MNGIIQPNSLRWVVPMSPGTDMLGREAQAATAFQPNAPSTPFRPDLTELRDVA
jgi:hypothetical protein